MHRIKTLVLHNADVTKGLIQMLDTDNMLVVFYMKTQDLTVHIPMLCVKSSVLTNMQIRI